MLIFRGGGGRPFALDRGNLSPSGHGRAEKPWARAGLSRADQSQRGAAFEIRNSTRQRGSRMRAGISTAGRPCRSRLSPVSRPVPSPVRRRGQSTVANGDSHEVSGTGSRLVPRLPCAPRASRAANAAPALPDRYVAQADVAAPLGVPARSGFSARRSAPRQPRRRRAPRGCTLLPPETFPLPFSRSIRRAIVGPRIRPSESSPPPSPSSLVVRGPPPPLPHPLLPPYSVAGTDLRAPGARRCQVSQHVGVGSRGATPPAPEDRADSAP